MKRIPKHYLETLSDFLFFNLNNFLLTCIWYICLSTVCCDYSAVSHGVCGTSLASTDWGARIWDNFVQVDGQTCTGAGKHPDVFIAFQVSSCHCWQCNPTEKHSFRLRPSPSTSSGWFCCLSPFSVLGPALPICLFEQLRRVFPVGSCLLNLFPLSDSQTPSLFDLPGPAFSAAPWGSMKGEKERRVHICYTEISIF